MNLYDTVPIFCVNCKNEIGEIDCDAQIIRPKCGKCANPLPEGDNILYTVNSIKNQPEKVLVTH